MTQPTIPPVTVFSGATFGGTVAGSTTQPTNTFGGGTFGGGTPTPPQPVLDMLRVLLNDLEQPPLLSDEALSFILAAAGGDTGTAAALGWRWKAIKYGDPNRLVRGSVGSESFEFPSAKDLIAYAEDAAKFFDGLRDKVAPGGGSMLALNQAQPCFFGISGPYNDSHAHGRGDECWDVTRYPYGLHGSTG